MPGRGTTKKRVTGCLVCSLPTTRAHLGLDICRACTIFYRRYEKRTDLTCRSNSNECPIGAGLNCKKCRFDHLHKMLKQPIQCAPTERGSSHSQTSSQSQDCSISWFSKTSESIPLLEKLRVNYRWMSHARLVGELNARPNPPHPQEINLRSPPTFPATFGSMNVAFRLLASSSMEFGLSSFPEFALFSEKEQWQLVINFVYPFRAFEGTYRAIEAFPDHPDRFLAGYTSYLSPEVFDHFFSDGPNRGDVECALKYIRNSDTEKRDIRAGREIIQRMEPREEEGLALFALLYWSVDSLSLRPEITQIADKYRSETLKELHSFYREALRLADYAPRLGQLMSFIQLFRCSNKLKEHFEMLRLLDIFADDTFIYTLQKD